jgi:site-specific DNA-methyltransferase (adenine-specific)
MPFKIVEGDCLDILKRMRPDSIHSVVSDPPYGISFLSKHWDHGVPGVDYWSEVLRVAKPGANLLAFGGTKKFHRLTCAIEDAGWEI